MVTIKAIFMLIAIHFIADFPFQGEFLANNKGKSWEILFYHCAVYAGSFLLFGKVSLVFALVLFVSHFFIDALKARWKVIKTIWFDQICHICIILIGVGLSL